MTAPTIDEFVSRIRDVGTFGLPPDTNPYDDLATDLGIDSLQIFELIVVVEAMAGCMLPPAQLPNLRTLADAYEYYWLCREEP